MRSITILFAFALANFFVRGTSVVEAHVTPAVTKHELGKETTERLRIKKARIRSITRWKYDVVDGKPTTTKQRALQQDYDAEGRLIRIVAFKDGVRSQEVQYTFDKQHRMLTDTDYDAAGKRTEAVSYRYGANGFVELATKTGADGKVVETSVYAYTSSSVVVERRSPDKTVLERTTFVHAQGLDHAFTSATQVDGKTITTLSVTQKLDERGAVSEKHVSMPDDAKSYVWLYSEPGLEQRWGKTTKQKKSGAVEWSETATYDKDGSVIETKRYDKDGTLIGYASSTMDTTQVSSRRSR